MHDHTSNEELIQALIKGGYLKTPEIIQAFRGIDRKNFVPDELSSRAYHNYPLPIGDEQTISQPLTVAFMLELLEPKKGERILDIGAGSGWQTAMLANIVSSGADEVHGKIVAMERIKKLYDTCLANISKYNFLEKGIIELMYADGAKGYKEGAPYDKIIAGAEGSEVPKDWKKQLRVGGKIVMPLHGTITVIEKISADTYASREFYGFRFVPLLKGKKARS